MNESTYTITLADGTVISDLRLNGNNYISKQPLYADVFEDNCFPVVINDGEKEEIHEYMQLVQISFVNDEYWFILRDLSDEELRDIKVRSDIDYIAMMTDVEI